MTPLPRPPVPLDPMLSSERPESINASDWILEVKFDGYRVMAHFGDGNCELRTRNYANATRWFPEIADPLSSMEGGPFIVDGVMCIFDAQGRSDNGALLDRSRRRRSCDDAPLATYVVFDILAVEDDVLVGLPLGERKARLSSVLARPLPNIQLAGYAGHQRDLLARWPAHWHKPESLVAKRVDSVYVPGKRSLDWVRMHITAPAHP